MNKDTPLTTSRSQKTKKTRFLSHSLLLFCFSIFNQSQASAATDEGLCKPAAKTVLKQDTFSTDNKTHLQSDNVSVTENNISRFTGNVLIQQTEKRIESDSAEYEKPTEDVLVKGNVKFTTPEMQIKSETAYVDLKEDYSLLKQTQFQSLNGRGRGDAASIEIKNTNLTELKGATYTTCDEGSTDWTLKSNSITLDHASRQGSASHAVLRFKGVPFFYFPYIRFPLGSERLSGFLFPYIGTSKRHGTELKTPYYWNIHPQMDATITPWRMTKRGLLLHTEFRYLSEQHQGSIVAERLNNDRIFKDDRQLLQWKHDSLPGLGWQTKAEYNYIADNQHFIDFSDNLNNSSITSLARSGEVSYNDENWIYKVRVEDYFILSGAEPYKRLPQFTFNSRYSTEQNAFNYAFQGEAVRFEHESTNVIGDRFYVAPSVSFPMSASYGHLIPKLSLNHTVYNLGQTSTDTQLSRTVPTFSLNGALFFDRDSELFDNYYLHTLEPQLYYVYTPYIDQSNFPVFDTSARAFDVNNFTSDYRFNGIDRIGDDNRLTAALTTRFINQEDGREVFMAKIGQVFYFTDRQVQLSGISDSSRSSNIITQVQFNPGNWKLSSQITWDNVLDRQLSSSNLIGYQAGRFGASITERFELDVLETREMNVNWKINPSWLVNASNLYDLRNERSTENSIGINYESCCWALRLSAKDRYLSNTQRDQGVYIELVLKGLGGFGVRGDRIVDSLDDKL